MKLTWLGIGFAAALGWAAACGGNVVVDGGTGGGTSTGTGPGTGPQSRCEAICEAGVAFGCSEPGQDCVQGCLELYAASQGCTSELDAFFDCVLGGTLQPGCGLPPQCIGVSDAYAQCLGGSDTCGDEVVACSLGEDGSCGCKGSCVGVEASVECTPNQAGTFDCTCYEDGALIATCQEANASCDFQTGCCAPYLYWE